MSIQGYGMSTSGDYTPSTKGYHAFGSVGQGDSNRGVIETTSSSCDPRTMDVTVTAKEDQGDSTVLLEIGSYEVDKMNMASNGAMYLTLASSMVMSVAYSIY